MANKKLKLEDVSTFRVGRWFCKLCADFDTAMENRMRDHAAIKHMVDLEPVLIKVPARGVLPDSQAVIIEEEAEE